MPDETPTPVSVENVAKVEVVAGDASAAPKPIVEKVTETKETTKTSGTPLPPPPAVIADDNIRKWGAQETVGTEFLLILTILYLLFFKVDSISKNALPFGTV